MPEQQDGAPRTGGAAPSASGSQTGAVSGRAVRAEERENLIDAITDLVRLFVDFVRQETGDLVRDKVVAPTQQAGMVVAFALAAAFTLMLGIGFVSTGALILLAMWVGWPAALFIVGFVLLAGAGGLTAMKMRSIQR